MQYDQINSNRFFFLSLDCELSGFTHSAPSAGQNSPAGAVGAVVYSGLTGGQLQQLVPLLLPLLLRVHQTRLRRKERHARTHAHAI